LSAPPQVFDWTPAALQAALAAEGLRPGQARQAVRQVGHALWRGGGWAQALDGLGRAARTAIEARAAPPPAWSIGHAEEADDGTRKLGFVLDDGNLVETVVIPAPERTTVCVSSQVGCGRRCRFCATGALGLARNLSAGEIVAQVWRATQMWDADRPDRPPVTNVVFMGMGEPLDNLDAVATAVAALQDDLGAGLSWRKITVSTVGVARRLADFFARVRAHLAVSLHAPDDARRRSIMPVHARCDLAALKAALTEHLPHGRDVLVEYIVFDRFNDSDADADLLADWLTGLSVRCNLIVANPGPDPTLAPPDLARVKAFQATLRQRGVRAMVRHPHGRAIGGACGQLAGRAAGEDGLTTTRCAHTLLPVVGRQPRANGARP